MGNENRYPLFQCSLQYKRYPSGNGSMYLKYGESGDLQEEGWYSVGENLRSHLQSPSSIQKLFSQVKKQKTLDVAAASSCLNPLKNMGCWRPQASSMQ